MRSRISMAFALLFAVVFTANAQADSLAYMSGAYHSSNYSAMSITKVELANMSWSSGYKTPPAYNNYTYVSPAILEGGNTYNIKVTRGSYSSVRRHAFIDWNNDGDFNDTDEKIAEDTATNSITVWDKPFTVPNNVSPGTKRLRVRLHYSYYTEGSYASYYTPYYYTRYGETEDYSVEVIVPPSPELAGGNLGGTYENVGFESTVSATTGAAPYEYSLNRITNADWVNIDSATGKIFGTPGAGSGGGSAIFEVTAKDTKDLTGSAMYSIDVLAPLGLPYSDDMNGAKVGNYVQTLGSKSAMTLAAVSGANGLALVASGKIEQPWALSPGSDTANLAVLDNPSSWNGGGSPDASPWSGEAMFVVAANVTQRLAAQFDYSIVNLSTLADKEYFTNFVVEYSENGKDWLRAKGSFTNSYDFFRTPTTGFERETVYMELSGDQSQVTIRYRWLVRNPWNVTEATYVAVDNLEVFVPVHFVGSSVLTPAQETVPYDGHAMTTFGGAAPVTVSIEAANPALNFLVQDNNGVWELATPSNQGPNLGTVGIQSVQLRATDALGRFRVETFSISISPAPAALTIETDSLPSSTGMTAYSETIQASGGVPMVGGQDYTFEMVTSSASWLSLDAATGVVSGMVPESDIGITHSIEVKVSDRIGTVRMKTYDIAIVEHMMLASPIYEPGTESFSYVGVLDMMGGTEPYTWQYVSGSKPIGLNLNASTGALTGAPYIGQTGTFEFVVSVKDSGTQYIEATVSIDIAARTTSTLGITTEATEFVDGNENNEFSTLLAAGGGVPPYNWDLLSNTLPTGLSLTPDGEIIGTPVAGSAGRYTLKVRISDALGNSAVENFTFDIAPEYFAPTITTEADMGVIGEGTTIVKLLEVSKGTAPYTWALVSGAFPNGITMNTAGGSLLGTAQAGSGTESGLTYNFTLSVTDAADNTDERTFSLTVTNDPANTFQVDVSETLPTAEIGAGHFSALLTAKNGVPPMSWTLLSGALPVGVELGEFGGLFGEPAPGQAGSYAFTVQVQDSIGNSAQQVLTLTVIPSGAVDPNEGVEVIDGLANLPTATAGGGGCAIDQGTSILLLLALMALAGVAIRRRRLA